MTGANIFVLTPAGARGLATAMGAAGREEAEEGAEAPPLSELEMSAIAEAANQTMAAAAGAIGVVLGQEIEISTPDTRVLDDPTSAADVYGTAPHATSTTFLIAGEACRLIQLVPGRSSCAWCARSTSESAERAGDGRAGGSADGAAASDADASPHSLALEDALGGISLRVWAELGRAHMPLGRRARAARRRGRRPRPDRRRARRPVRERHCGSPAVSCSSPTTASGPCRSTGSRARGSACSIGPGRRGRRLAEDVEPDSQSLRLTSPITR